MVPFKDSRSQIIYRTRVRSNDVHLNDSRHYYIATKGFSLHGRRLHLRFSILSHLDTRSAQITRALPGASDGTVRMALAFGDVLRRWNGRDGLGVPARDIQACLS